MSSVHGLDERRRSLAVENDDAGSGDGRGRGRDTGDIGRSLSVHGLGRRRI